MSSALLGAAIPSAMAIILLLLSPLLTAKVKIVVERQIVADAAGHSVKDSQVPPHFKTGPIGDYLEFTADAVQIVPATILPLVGAVLALATEAVAWRPTVILFAAAAIMAFALDAWVLTRRAADYVSRRMLGYSVVTWAALAVNVFALATTLWFGTEPPGADASG